MSINYYTGGGPFEAIGRKVSSFFGANDDPSTLHAAEWIHDTQDEWNAKREAIYVGNSQLHEQLTTDFEPGSINSPDPFDAMGHQQMHDGVAGGAMNPENVREAAVAWQNVAVQFRAATGGLRDGVSRVIEQGWSGTAAASAKSAVAQYATDAEQLSLAAELISSKLAEAHTGLIETRALMPEVPGGATAKLFGLIPSPGAARAAHHAQEEAEEEARRVMKTVYLPVALQTDSGVPVLPAASSPFGSTASGFSGPYGSADAPSGFSAGGGSVFPGPVDGGVGGAANLSGANFGTAGDPNPTTAASGSNPVGAADAADAAQQRVSTDRFGAGVPGASGGVSPGPAVGGGPVGAGSARGAGAGDIRRGGSGGGHRAGGSGGGVGRATSLAAPSLAGRGPTAGGPAAAPSVGAARPGAPGMGGVAPAGARKGSDADTEHKTPDYLITIDNGNELIGPTVKVAPPVIGI